MTHIQANKHAFKHIQAHVQCTAIDTKTLPHLRAHTNTHVCLPNLVYRASCGRRPVSRSCSHRLSWGERVSWPPLPIWVNHHAPPWDRAGQQLPDISSGDPGDAARGGLSICQTFRLALDPHPRLALIPCPRRPKKLQDWVFFTNEKMEASPSKLTFVKPVQGERGCESICQNPKLPRQLTHASESSGCPPEAVCAVGATSVCVGWTRPLT